MAVENKDVMKPRTLLIGLGGSGGEVLIRLYKRLTDDQKAGAATLYLDTDNRDLDRLREQSVRSEALGSADTVANVAAYLGDDDGVYDWLPNDEKKETVFLCSHTDTGASQIRYKSRLCLARFLENGNNALNEILDNMNVPGAGVRENPLRVIITSSIAGGTGAGSFIQVALYIRKYFRDNGQNNVQIIGLFGCPDLFSIVAENDQERESMFSNAYAAVRELNAMNLAVCGSNRLVGGYAKSVKIKIDTKSEGRLFDSEGKEFQYNYSAKPFDNIYLIDKNNAHGAVLRSLDQYYDCMADIAYTRLFSALEGTVRSGENNELNTHAEIPTAIYGSAGYSSVCYPYKDILHYLAERKTLNELDHKWSYLDSEWKQYCMSQQDAAIARGRVWKATDSEREAKFIESMRKLMDKNSNTDFVEFGPMVGITDGGDRATEYERKLKKALDSGNGIGKHGDGIFSLCTLPDVAKARKAARGCGVNISNGDGEEEERESYREQLQTLAADAQSKLTVLAEKLFDSVDRQVSVVVNTILPVTEEGRKMAKRGRKELNLFDGLLREDGTPVHPVAARYLLYRLRSIVSEYLNAKKQRTRCEEAMASKIRNLNLAFDDDKTDDQDITVNRYVSEELKLGSKLGKYAFWMENRARDDLDEFKLAIGETVGNIIDAADAELRYQVYEILLERLNGLIRQYEGLFDNIHAYRAKLLESVERDLMAHVNSSDRTIYVGATPAMKRYYYSSDHTVRSALAAAGPDACAAVGEAVFETLLDRYLNLEAQERAAARLSYDDDQAAAAVNEEAFKLDNIFDAMVKAYENYLAANAPGLNQSVIGALIDQCCEENGIRREKIQSDPATRVIFSNAFVRVMKDLVDKSAPMLRYNVNRVDRYFTDEQRVTDHSKPYRLMGLDPVSAEELERDFPAEGNATPLATLQQKLGLTALPVVSETFKTDGRSDRIFCFSAVHCLQPTQIQKFNEDYEKSYYNEYRTHLADALWGERLSETGHLDKSWHLRGAMPYISRKLELEWQDNLMKAFVYAMRKNKIVFTVDSENRQCFKFGGRFVHYPKGRLVQANNISQLIEYLAEMELEVPKLARLLDEDINKHISKLSARTGSLSSYKAGMTTDALLVELRKNLLEYEPNESFVTSGHGENFQGDADYGVSESDQESIRGLRCEIISGEADKEDEIRLDRTMGGLLEIAWKVHKSEENLRQDRDYGEALLRCGAYILDRFCMNMYGQGEQLEEDSPEYHEYVDLYNHAVQKMVEEFVVVIARNYKLDREKFHNALGRTEASEDYPKLRIPTAISSTREFRWIAENWKIKPIVG